MIRPIHLSETERLQLADCVRLAYRTWARDCGTHAVELRRLDHEFSDWSKFVAAVEQRCGLDYRPTFDSLHIFPLTVREISALAAAIELETADRSELEAALYLACFCPFAQPDIGSRAWRTHCDIMARVGFDPESCRPGWAEAVLARTFRLRQVCGEELTTAAE